MAARYMATVPDAGESALRLALHRAGQDQPFGLPSASDVRRAQEEIAEDRERLSDLGVCTPRMPMRRRSLEDFARMDAMVARMKAGVRR